MTYTGGLIYYTIAGDPTLHARSFSIDSGIVGPAERNVDQSINWTDTSGLIISGDRLYWSTRSDGDLRRVTFTDGHPNAAPAALVSGPTIDGHDWRTHAMFLPTTK